MVTNNPYIGLSRSLLALSLFITLVFSSTDVLFDNLIFQINKENNYNINFFHLFGFNNLIYAKMISIVILMFVILGFVSKITGILQWWITWSFLYSSSIIEGGDQIASILTLLFIPITIRR